MTAAGLEHELCGSVEGGKKTMAENVGRYARGVGKKGEKRRWEEGRYQGGGEEDTEE